MATKGWGAVVPPEEQAAIDKLKGRKKPAPARKRDTIQERFEKWSLRHPEIYERFVKMAHQIRKKGRKRYSARTFFHVIRWHTDISGKEEGEPFKINNDYSSRMARKLIEEDSSFQGFFSVRKLQRE